MQGIDNDYAIIPGTKKPSMLQPGAQKLLLLFGLGFRYEVVNQCIDFNIGEVSFLIKCLVFRKSDGFVVAESYGYCSNQESKYKKLSASDIVNTVLKMSQKRALIGATIAATGASDYFTQDLDDMDKTKVKDMGEKFTKKETSKAGEFLISGGKFDGKKIKDVPAKDLENYINFITKSKEEKNEVIDGKLKLLIDNAREFLRGA